MKIKNREQGDVKKKYKREFYINDEWEARKFFLYVFSYFHYRVYPGTVFYKVCHVNIIQGCSAHVYNMNDASFFVYTSSGTCTPVFNLFETSFIFPTRFTTFM